MPSATSPEALYKQRKYSDVIAQLEPAYPFGETENDLEKLRILGQSYVAQKNYDLAIRTFVRHIELQKRVSTYKSSPGTVTVDEIILAHFAAEHGHLEAAEKPYIAALNALSPKQSAYHELATTLALLYAMSNEPDVATKCATILKDVEATTGSLSNYSSAVRQQLAAIYAKNHRVADAETLYKSLVQQYEHADQSDDRAHALCHLASFYFTYDNPSEAEAPLLEALRIRQSKPDNGDHLAGMTLEYLQLLYEKLHEESRIIKLFSETTPDNTLSSSTELHAKRAVIFARAKDFAACEKELLKIIELQKNQTPEQCPVHPALFHLIADSTRYCLGQIYVSQKRYADAIAQFEQVYNHTKSISQVVSFISAASSQAPEEPKRPRDIYTDIFGFSRDYRNMPDTNHYLAATYALQGRLDDAQRVCEQSIKSETVHENRAYILGDYYNALSWIHLQKHDYQRALSTLDAAINTQCDVMQKICFLANKSLVLESHGGDPSVAVNEAIEHLQPDNPYFDDPLPDFGIDNGEDYGHFGPRATWNCYRTASGELRLEPWFGWICPPLVLFLDGALAPKDFALYPGQFFRGGTFDPSAPDELEFINWSFEFHHVAERLLSLAHIRMGDIYLKREKPHEAEVAYRKAMAEAQSDRAGPDVLALAYQRMIELYKMTNRAGEAETLEMRARKLPTDKKYY